MAICVACGGKAKEKRIELDFCRICGMNFNNRIQLINDSDSENLENNYSKVINSIENKDNYNNENKQKVIEYVKKIYDLKKEELDTSENEKKSSGLIYTIKGNRGRTLEVYKNKVVIITDITVGSIVTGNTTDGKKTIYYKDVIGLQFKLSKTLIGFLQFETASSTMNNEKSNFWNENTFTFDETTTTNIVMQEVEKYIDKQLEKIKSTRHISIADEIRKFKTLLDDQIISDEEFEKKKNELLNL